MKNWPGSECDRFIVDTTLCTIAHHQNLFVSFLMLLELGNQQSENEIKSLILGWKLVVIVNQTAAATLYSMSQKVEQLHI